MIVLVAYVPSNNTTLNSIADLHISTYLNTMADLHISTHLSSLARVLTLGLIKLVNISATGLLFPKVPANVLMTTRKAKNRWWYIFA